MTLRKSESLFGKYTRIYFILTFIVAFSAAAYVSYNVFFAKPKAPVVTTSSIPKIKF